MIEDYQNRAHDRCPEMQHIDTIGIIAGNRSLPLAFAEQARAQGVKRLVAVAFENETNPALAQMVDESSGSKSASCPK